MDYVKLMSAVIKKQMTFGDKIALNVAKEISGIKVSESGDVTSGASKEKLDELIKAYIHITGPVAVLFCKTAVRPLIKDKEELPEALR